MRLTPATAFPRRAVLARYSTCADGFFVSQFIAETVLAEEGLRDGNLDGRNDIRKAAKRADGGSF